MKKMNLLFVAPTHALGGGGEISHYEIILAAKARGHRVHVILPARGDFAKKLKKSAIGSTVIRYRWWSPQAGSGDALDNLWAVSRIAKIARDLKAECIITNSLNIPWAALAAAATDLPHVWITREGTIDRFKYLDERYDFIKSYGNLILANSKTNAEFTKSKTGLANVSYFYPYVETKKIKLNRKITTTRLVMVGNIMPDKNQLEFIKALVILHKQGKHNIPALLIGGTFDRDKKYLEKIQKTIKDNKLQESVSLMGFHPNPYSLIGPNDIFVQASANESFGRTTVEAMKLGLILVAADIPTTKETVSHGGAVLYKSGEPRDLAAKLAAVLDNLDASQKNAKAAQAKTLKNLSEEASHDPFFTNIAKIIGKPNPRREFRHLLYQLNDLKEIAKGREKKMQQMQAAIDRRDKRIEDILNSKAYKTALGLRKILGR
jgi:glycosyltransferase involved in cell wall biosynthesis